MPAQHRREIALGGDLEGLGPLRDEAALTVVAEHRQAPATAGPDQQVFPTIAIEIEPGHARAELAEFARQEGLAGEVVKRLVVMSMVEKRAHVGEDRPDGWGLTDEG